MNFTPTKDLPPFNPAYHQATPKKPLPAMSNGEIDVMMQTMLDKGALRVQLPTTQWSRRMAVALYLIWTEKGYVRV